MYNSVKDYGLTISIFQKKYVFKNYRLDSLKNEDVYSQKVTTNIDQFEQITLKFVKTKQQQAVKTCTTR